MSRIILTLLFILKALPSLLPHYNDLITEADFNSDIYINGHLSSRFRYLQSEIMEVESSIGPYRNGNGSLSVFKTANYVVAKERAYRLLNLIYQRFEYHNWYWYQFFLGAFNMPTGAWDMMKYKVAVKSMENIGKKSRFLMIFGGSSVTAGHDNYFNQSYPMVYHRRMRPIFDALGIELIVRNIAHGANPCRPFDLCYEAMGGKNPDWISWEQSYNCKTADIFELMAKQAILNKGMLFLTASGAFVPDHCDYANDTVPWVSEEWTPEVANIANPFRPDKEYFSSLRTKLQEWYDDGNPVSRFTNALQGKYQGAYAHGFSVWGRCTKMYEDLNRTTRFGSEPYNMRPLCHEQGGPHWMSKETAQYALKFMFKKWHPSIGFHILRAEVMAYNYVAAILDALIMIEEDLRTSTHDQLLKEYRSKLDALYVPPPERTLHCWNEECGTKPVCHTNFLPNYNPEGLLDKIIIAKHPAWKVVSHAPDLGPEWGYLDQKVSYEAKERNAWMVLKIDVPRDDSLVMACGTIKDSLKHVHYYLDVNATDSCFLDANSFTLEGSYSATSKCENRTMEMIDGKVKFRGDECYNLWHTPNGRHLLKIQTVDDHLSSITHIISFE